MKIEARQVDPGGEDRCWVCNDKEPIAPVAYFTAHVPTEYANANECYIPLDQFVCDQCVASGAEGIRANLEAAAKHFETKRRQYFLAANTEITIDTGEHTNVVPFPTATVGFDVFEEYERIKQAQVE